MNTNLSFLASLKAIIIPLLLSLLAFGCENNEKDKPPTELEIRIAKEKEEEIAFSKYAEEIRSKHNAIFLDSLFNQDSTELTFSYIIEKKITMTQQPILAKAIIFDINKLNDTTYLLMSAIIVRKKKHGIYMQVELKCSEKLINQIENQAIANGESSVVFLVAKFNNYSPVVLEYKDFGEYLSARKATGICLGIEFSQDFQQFLKENL